MNKKQRPTNAQIRTRLEEFAVEANIDTSDTSEPLDELIDRISFGLQEELEELTMRHDDLHDELEQLKRIAAKNSQPQPEQST